MDTIPKRRSLSDFCDFFKYFCTRLVFGCFTDVAIDRPVMGIEQLFGLILGVGPDRGQDLMWAVANIYFSF